VKDEEAFRPAQAYDLGGVSTWFFEVDIHSRCARAYLSILYAVVKGQARGHVKTREVSRCLAFTQRNLITRGYGSGYRKIWGLIGAVVLYKGGAVTDTKVDGSSREVCSGSSTAVDSRGERRRRRWCDKKTR
jgi:hypothetical protein